MSKLIIPITNVLLLLILFGCALDEIRITDKNPVSEYEISVSPVPAKKQVVIYFSLARSGPARVSIENIVGDEIELLFEQSAILGQRSVVWDFAEKKNEDALFIARLQTEAGSFRQAFLIER